MEAREINENISAWTTNFPKLLKFTTREKELNPNVLVAYKSPQTIAALLTNYKIQAHKNSEQLVDLTLVEMLFMQPRGSRRNGEKN